jgi:hypothetical protein
MTVKLSKELVQLRPVLHSEGELAMLARDNVLCMISSARSQLAGICLPRRSR